MSNVGKLRSGGAEIDARATPFDGLTLSFADICNDAYYVSYTRAQPTYLQTGSATFADLSGRPTSGAPKWPITSALDYVRTVGNVTVYGGGDASYQSGFFTAVNRDPFAYMDGYALFGLRARAIPVANGTFPFSPAT